MPTSSDPLNGVHFSYTHGLCLVCGESSGTKLYCPACEPKSGPSGQTETVHTITELIPGQYGYIANNDVYAVDQQYWVFTDAEFVSWPKDDKTVKIWKTSVGYYTVDMRSLDFRRLGWFDFKNQRPSALLILDVDHVGNVLPNSSILTKVVNMNEGDEGYIETLAIFYDEGSLFILGSALVSSTRDKTKTVKITKGKWIVEIDRNFIKDTDLISARLDMNIHNIYLPADLK